jgi:hypothetical protein
MSYSPESVRNTSVSDQPTGDDSLGFKPYVTAIAEFLLNEQTKPPLTLSIEGEWGSGKSSFMKQLETYLRNKGGKTVWFNAWRHDKAEAVWAAFALSFIKQISTPKEYTWQAYKEIFFGHVRLAISRFDLKKSWPGLIQAATLGIFVICAALAIPFILVIYGIEGIRLFFQAWKHPDQLLQAFLYLLGIAGGGSLSLAGLASLLKKLPSVIGGPKFNLIKYLKSPDYAKQSAFIEEFHEDFTKIVDAYIGEGRVYVFIDDLDRCEHSKSADLMQAMNLMIADDPSVIFILGMDREKVAASLTVKYENVLRYLPSENSEIDADILERYSTNKGLAYGYTFIEKFIQLPFQVPQPSPENFKKFFAELGTSKNSESNKITPSQSKLNSLKSKLNAFLPFKFQRNKLPSSQYQPPNHGELSTEKTQQPAIEIKRSEIIQLSFDSDSQTVRDILMMVAPALDYNPRRIKQFIN